MAWSSLMTRQTRVFVVMRSWMASPIWERVRILISPPHYRFLSNLPAANDWGSATVNITQVGDFDKAPYKYKLTPLVLVETIVKLGAGIGKV